MKNHFVRVDKESIELIRYLAENLFDVPASQGLIIRELLSFYISELEEEGHKLVEEWKTKNANSKNLRRVSG